MIFVLYCPYLLILDKENKQIIAENYGVELVVKCLSRFGFSDFGGLMQKQNIDFIGDK